MLALLVVVTLVATACQPRDGGTGQTPKTEDKAQGGTLRLELSEPAQLDPAQSDDSEETIVTRQVYEGLVTYHEKTAAVQPGVATKWEANDDKTVWTFTLRKDAKFSNGDPVTAESFIRGWNRASSPEIEEGASPLNTFFASVVGFKEHFGDAEADPPTVGNGQGLSGLKAVDDYTLEVTLTQPDPEFYVKTGHTAFFPLPDQETIDAAKPSFSEQPIGNGQFMLEGNPAWQHDQQIRAVPNPNYKGGSEPTSLDEVIWRIFPDFDAMYLEWEKGNLDYIRVPTGKEKEAEEKYKDSYLDVATTTLTYVGLTIKSPPIDNPKVRQALSLAIDRDAIIKAIFNDTQVRAEGIIPPVMPGFRKEGVCEFCDFDVPRAKKLLAEAGVDTSKPLTFAFNTGAGHEQWVQAVAQQLKDNLGLTVTPEPVTGFSRNFIPRLRQGQVTGLFRLGWGMDYPSPQNFLAPLFHTNAIGHDNLTEYSNKKFDDLLDEANTKDKESDRIKLYQQAEDVVLADMPIIPMWFRRSIRLANLDTFGGLGVNPFDNPSIASAYLKKDAPKGGTTPSQTIVDTTAPATTTGG